MFDLAIFYRMAGGFVGMGSTTLTRVRWAMTMGLYMAFVSMVHGEGPMRWMMVFIAVFIGAFVGRLIPHAKFQSVASIPNSIGMTIVQALRLALIVVPYAVTNWVGFGYSVERLMVIGLAVGSGIAYYVGNKYLDGEDFGIYYRASLKEWRISSYGITTLAQTPAAPAECLDQCAVGGTEWGELLTGFLCYQAMYMLLLVLP